MNHSRFQVQTQLGAGRDGACYRALDGETSSAVELRMIGPARADRERWATLERRLRLAAMLDHAGVRRIVSMDIDSDAPWVALEVDAPTRLAVSHAGPMAMREALELGRALAGSLAEAHRIGLAHGRLGPGQVGDGGARGWLLDFTDLDVFTSEHNPKREELDTSCRAPEQRTGAPGDTEADVYALGAILYWLIGGESVIDARLHVSAGLSGAPTLPGLPPQDATLDAPVGSLLKTMLAGDPDERPSANEVAARLNALLTRAETVLTSAFASVGSMGETSIGFTTTVNDAEQAHASTLALGHLGRFRLLEKLGQGGMGTVFRAQDAADGSIVAIKVLRSNLACQPDALRRFHKEARLLAEIKNPFVTNLLEVNEDSGVHYLALEFVDGQGLDHLLLERTRLNEREGLGIMATVAHALEEAHDRGIVHRDVKPQNILLVKDGAQANAAEFPPVKLSDFGLARHAVQTESLELTRAGAILGTPLYMAPEQCNGLAVGPPTDVYAMGATLFHLLAGRPPFEADTALGLVSKHTNEPPPDLKSLNPSLSDGVCHVVAKALAKPPEHRYATAGELRRDLERLLRGEPTSLAAHPRLPSHDPEKIVTYEWTWDLSASPRQLWPFVSNTERLNRAVGLPAIDFTTEPVPDSQARRLGQFRRAGISVAWEEHPFEWVEGRKMGVLREYSAGPWIWLTSVVELAPRAEGGTRLSHRVQIEPRNLMGRTITAVNVGMRSKQGLDRVYRRIDAAIAGKLGSVAVADPFEEPARLNEAQQQRLEGLIDLLSERGVSAEVAERLGEFLAAAPDQEVARIRPLALARRLEVDPDGLVAACLVGAREGLLILLWDLLCPVCRIPSEVRESLKQLRDHGHCEACQIDYTLDFASAVELVFRVHPEVRTAELGTYCVGGPAHSPHVAAQARVGPGERIELELELDEGPYRLRGLQLPFSLDFRVQPGAPSGRLELDLAHAPLADRPQFLHTGGQVAALANSSEQELLVRIERLAARDDALTAARASALALFRELFPGEVLSPGQLVSVAAVTLLVTELDMNADLDDAHAFRVVHEHFRTIEQVVKDAGGALVKTVGDGTVSSFPNPASALRAALALPSELNTHDATRGCRLRMGLHRGMAMAATINDQLDYFGQTVKLAFLLPPLAQANALILTPAVALDPAIASLLHRRGLTTEVLPAHLPGLREGFVNEVLPWDLSLYNDKGVKSL
ncbi:MAG TPA: protein kinase [Isosphaeraceae bacterium]|jgi:serine/threonine protein kinase/class 3 adenylate cyclase|nr:protein kinase [Isosphaeraceae bacterium]